MNSIVGLSFLVEETCIQKEGGNDYSNQILHSCKQLIWLIESFLDSLLIDNGHSRVNLRRNSLDKILDGLLSEFSEELKLTNYNEKIVIIENLCRDNLEVLIDTSKLDRIMRSLYQNAINNAKTGYIKIGSNFTEGYLTFYILDTWQDYCKCREFLYTNDMEESLTKFFDINSAINITLARKLIQTLGGTIWIEPYDITGTGIYFSVPVKVDGSSTTTLNKNLIKPNSQLNDSFATVKSSDDILFKGN